MRKLAISEMLAAPSCWQTQLPCRTARAGNLPFESDVVIVGAGIGGLAAALRALESGYSVTVLEAGYVGSGASGRNSGFVVPIPSRHSPESLQHLLGENTAPFLAALRETAESIFEYTPSEITVKGWVQPMVRATKAGAAELAKNWMRLGVKVEPMEPEALESSLGTPEYAEGLHFSDAGAINPLAFVYQLADTINRKGGQIIEHCSALDVRPQDRWIAVQTQQGEIKAGRVFIAGNAYGSAASRKTRRAVSPLALTLATFAVPQLHSGGGLLPFSDNRKDMWFARRLGRKSLLTGCFALPLQNSADCSALLQDRIKRLYGTVVQEPEQQWAGWVGLTPDGMPMIHHHDERIMGWSGCNGRGIALSMLMGRTLMDRLCGVNGLHLLLSSGSFKAGNAMTWLAQMVIALDRRKQRRTVLAS
ncbi:NAD(P)/FAD-dependent oxidoreductase [Pseudomonas sp. KB_15]|uniref:NAD(P)/FAD-dependent oxidoreductase n=1 Tax=Pseudomonas sp. KB_15 TaxID=3233035 RepID=UPI003F9D019B